MANLWQRPRFFAGWTGAGFQIFRCLFIPTRSTHGARYGFCYGPYRTRFAARDAVARDGLPVEEIIG